MSAPDERAAPPADAPARDPAVTPGVAASAPTSASMPAATPTPLYWRLLRLRHVHPNGWQRALLVEGVFGLAAVLTLADVATAWTLVVLPVAVALVVKLNDVVAGLLAPAGRDEGVVRADERNGPDEPPPTG